jgi:hypothetical protein
VVPRCLLEAKMLHPEQGNAFPLSASKTKRMGNTEHVS